MNDIAIVEMDDFKKQRVGVLCLPGLESFLPAIVEHLKKTYSVRTYYGTAIGEIEKVVNWCDILFLEWANNLAIEITTKMPILAEKQVLIRCHSYEVLSNFLPQINWQNVNNLVFVADHIFNIACKQLPNLPEMVDISIVPNGV